MTKMIFVNLPVADVAASTAFYTAIGAEQNPMFSDETASCMVLSDTIYAMLLSHEKFASFIPGRTIADAKTAVGALFALSVDSRDDVDATIEKVARAGGTADATPVQDHGFMFSRSFADPNGHIWEVFWMDPAATAGDAATMAVSAA
ncbi:VOC family protein [Sphingobium boeckii]|uniref:VOC domain-containing protein n=1 Tax=Sphingobium boeckii TaxID=1082345 RepID=A0A7W9AF20_9SPHN|nr:VOC family protein [Sphingobium boeckii]MBB5684487.1 hypothetical protein [Sphingobium boeckii]